MSSLTDRPLESFRLLVDAVEDYAIFMLDPEGRVASWNAGARRIKGYEQQEILGQHFSIFYPEDANEAGWPEHELAAARAQGRFEDEGWRVRRDGTTFWANVVITCLRDTEGRHIGFAKVTRDLTERRRIEESLRLSEERFRLMVESVEDHAVFMLDPDGIVTTWNVGAQRIHGYVPADVIGRPFFLFEPADEGRAERAAQMLETARTAGRFQEEGWRTRKDGTRFWANVIITPFYDRSRTLLGYVKLTRDETARRHAEQLEDAARRMEEFLAVLAHELRNPLAPILNATGIMRLRRVDDPNLAWSRDVIDRQARHLARLLDDLLDVGRITTGKLVLGRSRIDVADVVHHAIEMSQPLLDARRQPLVLDLPREPIQLDGDPIRLAQVLTNLLNNASKFTPAAARIHLETRREGMEAVIRVRDSGIGIDSDLLPVVFDLFRQGSDAASTAQGGLGIGLTIARRLVELHGGSLEAESDGAGLGSTFTVRLPLARDEAGVPATPSSPSAPSS